MICRNDAAQLVNDVLVCVKRKLTQSPECMPAIAKIVVQLLLQTDDSNKVAKLLMQVHVQDMCHCRLHYEILTMTCHIITLYIANYDSQYSVITCHISVYVIIGEMIRC